MRVFYLFILISLLLVSCQQQEDSVTTGSIEVRFDNIVGSFSTNLLSEQWSEEYRYTNELDQSFNLVTLKYIISNVIFEGPDGAYYEDPLIATTDNPSGLYLVNEADISSQRIRFSDLSPGVYNKVTFTLGVEQEGVDQGAGILLDGMFWTWNTGYIALKIEGQSPDSAGEALGDAIDETNPSGFAYHVGGWESPNNNRTYTIEFERLTVSPSYLPEVHIVMDVKRAFSGENPTDFSLNNSIHSPRESIGIVQNFDDLFQLSHVHQ